MCDQRVGFVTSGDYGPTRGKSLAMSLTDTGRAGEGAELIANIIGSEPIARITAPTPYDSASAAMKG